VRRAAASVILLFALIASAPSVRAQGFDGRVGAFLPRQRDCGVPSSVPAEYTLFQDVCELYAVNKGAFDGWFGGAEYNHVVMKNVEVGVHFDYSSKTVDTFYRDYERPPSLGGGNIYQTLRLQTWPLGVSVRFIPTSKSVKFAPFVGGGVDAVFYHYEEYGDFIDFSDPNLSIQSDHFIDDGTAFGVHALGGFRYYFSRDFALVGEARYMWSGHDMHGDFSPNGPGLVNRIDLSGWTFTGGIHVRF
jgi:hypothetical protein